METKKNGRSNLSKSVNFSTNKYNKNDQSLRKSYNDRKFLMQQQMSSRFADDVEKRAEFLLQDVRKMTNTGGIYSLSYKKKKKVDYDSGLVAYAMGESALAGLKSSTSMELDFLMTKNGTKDSAFAENNIHNEKKNDRDGNDDVGDDREEEVKRENKYREKYMSTYTGLDAYSSEGTTKLEMLISKAQDAQLNAVPDLDGVRHGAAIITKGDKVYTGCNIESRVESLRASAERTAIVKACSDGQTEFAGIVITCDAMNDDGNTLMVSGSSRQFLAEFGDYPVYIVQSDGTRLKYTTYELFPTAAGRRVPTTPMRGESGQDRLNRSFKNNKNYRNKNRLTHGAAPKDDHNVHEWSVKDVVAWVEDIL